MKKTLTKSLAICLLMVSFFSSRAQQDDLLKSFINKNDIAIRNVQKHSINSTDPSNQMIVKELLQFQIASVKLFSSNPAHSADIAYAVREKCTEFLSKNSKGSPEYLALTDNEKTFFSSPKKVDHVNSDLNKEELQKVNSVDTKNPQLFNDLNTKLQ